MSTPVNYSGIDRPYNALLERDVSDITSTSKETTPATTTSDPTTTSSGVGTSIGGAAKNPNGNVETQPVKSDGAMGNVWIRNFIRSDNWKPKSVGFTIDGRTGYAEFTNVYVSGQIQALTGQIGGWTIGADSLYGTTTGTIKTSATAGIGSNGVVLDKDGLRGYDSVLGLTFNLPTDGTPPTFSSGVINYSTFNVNTNAVIRTSDTVGDGTVNSAGILMNNTGFYATQSSQTLANANVKILIDGSAFFKGTITAAAGAIGGFEIGTDYIRDVANSFGMTSVISGGNDVRFWAGDTFVNREDAPFHVHEDGSTVVSNLRRKDFHWLTFFESIDGYDKGAEGTGVISLDALSGVSSYTGNVNGNKNQFKKGARFPSSDALSWDKNQSGRFHILIQNTVADLSVVYTRGVYDVSTARHIGFIISDGALSATVANGTTETQLSLGVTLSNNFFYGLSFVYTAGVGVDFYQGTSLLGTITTNLPTGTTGAEWLIYWQTQTLTNDNRWTYLSLYDFWQAN